MNQSAFESCMQKQLNVKLLFKNSMQTQQKYEKIIELGRQLPAFPAKLKRAENLVKGCQSQLYLMGTLKEGKVHFQAYSEALISSGLAALLLLVYNDESPQTILSCPPLFLEELGVHASLSPSRSNGLSSLFLRMKQHALHFLTSSAI